MRPTTVAALVVTTFLPAVAEAAGGGFDPRVIVVGEAREEIKSTPITQRPYRPLHVYGNTVRRRHKRGGTQPTSAGNLR